MITDQVTDFAVPRTTVRARLLLTRGDAHEGVIFLMPRASSHAGAETPLDMLNRPEAAFPFRGDDGDDDGVLLVTKAQTVCLTVVREPNPSDQARLTAAKSIEVEVVLANELTFVGSASLEMPESHSRVLDYLNAVPAPFFTLVTSEALHHINLSHVLYVRPRE